MNGFARLLRRPAARVVALALLALVPVAGLGTATLLRTAAPVHAASTSTCQLASAKGDIQHVIALQFDNVHFTRDNPNVPSDLEQMPHLLTFLEQNGALLTDHHTPLIAHTGTDILTSLTGVYGDRMGMPISNSYRYFTPSGASRSAGAFAYWTDPLNDAFASPPTDTTPQMIGSDGKIAPAPWVPFTRAGCNYGAVASANTVLENIGTDIPTVFGANSPEAAEVKANPNQANADFVGVAVHCAKSADLCSTANGGKADLLPTEPGGYSGFNGLFGHKSVGPQISPNGPLTDLGGNVIKSAQGNVGFPGFDGMSAATSLAYVAAMQEHGVPVTFAYISDAHDNHTSVSAYGPGDAGYVGALKSYDDAFAAFFDRLAQDGITQSNTLFVVTSDENDHFVGGTPSPAGCDGVTTACTYSQIGEINGNLTGLLATQQNITTPFAVHSDSAPNFYLNGKPGETAQVTRDFERAAWNLRATNPLSGQDERIANYLADPTEMQLLHMVTADPNRTPTLTMFAKPDYYLTTGKANCAQPCIFEAPAFAWNHGDFSPDINVTWLGLVGPGVRQIGANGDTWTDHADIRPTILSLVGLHDDYVSDGRVIAEVLTDWAVPQTLRAHRETLLRLGAAYKQINAPVGHLAGASLQAATTGIAGGSDADDSAYATSRANIAALTADRDALATKMRTALDDAQFGGKALNEQDAKDLIAQADALLARADALAAGN